jgi:glycosyltransferase involved in cell wall biosynthesis
MMKVSILIATYGDDAWRELARSRAFPSADAQGAEEVLVFHDPEGSIASVRNEIAAQAKGDWLCVLDADDELAPSYLGAMANALHREREYSRDELLLTPSVQKIRKGRPSKPDFYPEVDLERANWLIIGTLVSRTLLEQAGGFPDYPHGFEDWGLWYKCHRLGARVVRVPKAVYIQHVNPESKHRVGWRDRKWQVATHQRVERELAAWQP